MKRKNKVAGMLFSASLLMLSFEPSPGEGWFAKQVVICLIALTLMGLSAWLFNKKTERHV